jgi:molecular chaperone GrpE (heat shock protein)
MRVWPGKQPQPEHESVPNPQSASRVQDDLSLRPQATQTPTQSASASGSETAIGVVPTGLQRIVEDFTSMIDEKLRGLGEQISAGQKPSRCIEAEDVVAKVGHELQSRLEPERVALQTVLHDVSQMRETLELQPRKLRELGQKIDQVTTAITEGRYDQLVHQLIDFEDLLGRAERESVASQPALQPSVGTTLLTSLRAELRQILLLNAVTEVIAEQGMAFEPSQHRCVDTVVTADPASDGKIDRVIRAGFRAPNRMLRHPDVVVFKLLTDPQVGQVSAVYEESRRSIAGVPDGQPT